MSFLFVNILSENSQVIVLGILSLQYFFTLHDYQNNNKKNLNIRWGGPLEHHNTAYTFQSWHRVILHEDHVVQQDTPNELE